MYTLDYSVIVVNYNGERIIEKCVRQTLLAMQVASHLQGELIVVDNASCDNSRQILSEFATKVRLLLLEKNIIMAAYNKGAEIARGKYLMMLNNDHFMMSDCLTKAMIPFANHNDLFQVCIQSLNEHDQSYQFGKAACELKKGQIWLNFQMENPQESAFVTLGGLGLYRADIFVQLGGFCPLYHPFYWEDADLAYNAWKQGYRVWYETEAKAEHRHQASISRCDKNYVRRVNRRNKILFFWLNVSSLRFFLHHFMYYPIFAWRWYREHHEIDYLLIPFLLLLKLPAIIKEKIKRLRKTVRCDEEVIRLNDLSLGGS